MTEHHPEYAAPVKVNAWQRFWERGGLWKAIVFAAVYYAVYQLLAFPMLALFPPGGAVRGEAGSPLDYFFSVGISILIVGILLVILAASIGWLGQLFGKQPIKGRGWMWIAIAAVLLVIVANIINIDWAAVGLPLAVSYLAVGLCIGFVEEIVTRGFVVNLMRKAGYRETVVALVSAAIFAALHAGNFFGGQSLLLTLQQVAYTFGFGICMYLALRVTGTLIVPILLHAMTDPTGFLWALHPAPTSVLSLVSAFNNYIIFVVGIVLFIVLIFKGGKDRAYPKGVLEAASPAPA